MLIHPWDGAISETEWRDWLAAGHDFGQLAVNDPGNGAPHVIPTHFAVDGDTLLVHLARPNKVWAAIQARPIVVMSVVDDYAYIPTTWRAKAGPDEDGVPTSYYSAVQLTCHAEIVDDPQRKAELLRRQLAHFQPRGDHAQVGVRCLHMAGCSQESAVCGSTSRALPPSSSTTTTTRKSTAPGSPNALKAADPAGAARQPRSNAGASRKSANGNPATKLGAGVTADQRGGTTAVADNRQASAASESPALVVNSCDQRPSRPPAARAVRRGRGSLETTC
jgi:nitroimidazol reductase NimA-like FMN-containing flavoprotein (pyridoxamine 5'-phosphate oxidase superfamily)